jgi:hypothetical protein
LNWLRRYNLQAVVDRLTDLGAVSELDLLDLETSHVDGLGLKDLERKRFDRGMQELRSGLLPPPTGPQRHSSW